MNNSICLITGATNGIGKHTAIALAQMGATVVFTSRNKELGIATKQEIISTSGNSSVEVLDCELGSFVSILKACGEFRSRFGRLDVLVNNAGVWETERRLSRDGIEMTFAVNHLAPFLLTNTLLDLLRSTGTPDQPARVVTVASEAHRGGSMNFADIEGKQQFRGVSAYAQSKLANILFTKKLVRVLAADAAATATTATAATTTAIAAATTTTVTANCLHPGVVGTNLFNKFPAALAALGKLFLTSPAKGAETSIFLASSPAVAQITGEYFSRKKIRSVTKAANNAHDADELWELSRRYVGL
jgi:NAD(P)-dependent dehydrogenase (short-subunit alcohol dehydrogenase family)